MINYGQVTLCSNSQKCSRRAIVFTLTWKSTRYFVAISNSPQTWCQLSTDVLLPPKFLQNSVLTVKYLLFYFQAHQFFSYSVLLYHFPFSLLSSTEEPAIISDCPLSGAKPFIAFKLISTFSQHLLSVLSCECSHTCRKPDAMTFFSRVLVFCSQIVVLHCPSK